nr:hypothetical protein CFP56_38064 [Quercus suber]
MVEANLRAETNKALGTIEQKNKELAVKLTAKERVLELKAELQRAKEAVRMSKEAVEALEQASYNCRVQEIEIWLAEELAEVCRDYYKEVWAKALNWAGVPAAFEWRSAKNIFYPEDIHKVPTMLPPSAVLTLPSSEQPSTTQASLSPPEVSKGPSKACDQGQEVEAAKGTGAGQDGPLLENKGKGKEVKPLLEAKGTEVALTIKDVVSKAKDAKPKSKVANPKDDPPRDKA